MSLRYIIVGLGNIGTKRQDILGSHCVATVDPENLEADYRKISEVPDYCFDVAVLAVPNKKKIELLTYLLRKHKHVLVEKPLLFPDAAVAEEINSLAKNTGTVWYTSYNHRFEPLVIRLRELLHQGFIGSLYHGRMVYGNGTARNCIGTWRETGCGVLDDLGCHLIDLTDYLFEYTSFDYLIWKACSIESRVFDHCIFATVDQRITLECATTIWKNTFTIDIFGQLGSLHLNGLCKWGPTELMIRKRVFPSGVPIETQEIVDQGDHSWQSDFHEFEKRVETGKTSYESDLRISKALQVLAQKASVLA